MRKHMMVLYRPCFLRKFRVHIRCLSIQIQRHFVAEFICFCAHVWSWTLCARRRTTVFCLQNNGCGGRNKRSGHFARNVWYVLNQSFVFEMSQNFISETTWLHFFCLKIWWKQLFLANAGKLIGYCRSITLHPLRIWLIWFPVYTVGVL